MLAECWTLCRSLSFKSLFLLVYARPTVSYFRPKTANEHESREPIARGTALIRFPAVRVGADFQRPSGRVILPACTRAEPKMQIPPPCIRRARCARKNRGRGSRRDTSGSPLFAGVRPPLDRMAVMRHGSARTSRKRVATLENGVAWQGVAGAAKALPHHHPL